MSEEMTCWPGTWYRGRRLTGIALCHCCGCCVLLHTLTSRSDFCSPVGNGSWCPMVARALKPIYSPEIQQSKNHRCWIFFKSSVFKSSIFKCSIVSNDWLGLYSNLISCNYSFTYARGLFFSIHFQLKVSNACSQSVSDCRGDPNNADNNSDSWDNKAHYLMR